MIDERFVIIGAFINFCGLLSYLADTVKGKVKPNRVTWFLWTLIPFIAFFAQIKQGVGLTSLITFTAGFGPLTIFAASFINKKSFWNIRPLDIICGLISVLGVFLWFLTNNANLAILFSIIADGAAGLPTVIKAYRAPETENYLAFLLAAVSAIITLLAINTWDFAHFAFPLYIFLICTLLFILIKFRLGKRLIWQY